MPENIENEKLDNDVNEENTAPKFPQREQLIKPMRRTSSRTIQKAYSLMWLMYWSQRL